MFFDVTCARRLTLLEAELRYPHPHFSIYKGMNDAADFAMTRRKHFVLHVFEVPALDLTAIWLRHAKEHWFLEMGAGKDGADAVTGEDFEAKVVGEAISRLRISAELSVFDQDPGAADAA
ncbi:hypothetical protein GB928_007020 [Shinella curvata]|uniref:Uncharacterized protein n=1 Tax=Shinella curvata TaxID=1817964 RepID=A0ABT8XBB2_9HYPH|nr:hypothetical protein [Shinella curvata]MCJ8054673.1 hypothetical protein [Shinella curvata]MDO6120932.1 hypothetical protein [Shinella curvata]